MAQSNTAEAPEILVTGIRASLEPAINVKRNAPAIMDSISAEHISDSGTILNYTYVAGGPKLRLPGVSKNNHNIVLYYEKGPFSMRGAYKCRDRSVLDQSSYFGDDPFAKAFRHFDPMTGPNVDKHIQPHSKALNVMDESVVDGGRSRINRGCEDNGRRFTADVRIQL